MKLSTLSVFALIISHINNALSFAPSASLVTRRSCGHQHITIQPTERRRSHLSLFEECFGAMTGSFVVAGSELLDSALFAMNDSIMTPEYVALDSDPAVSIALAIMFVTLLTFISIDPEEGAQQKTNESIEKEELVVAQANQIESMPARDIVPEKQVATPENLGHVEKTSDEYLHRRLGIPLEVGALLKAYKDGDDNLFQRALLLLVETIRLKTSELEETKRLLRVAEEEKQSLEDKYDLRVYQLSIAEEKLKKMRSMDRQ